jgi:hypothetical protein
LELCKLAAFFEGGLTYTDLCNMPVDEVLDVIECANEIANQRRLEMEKARRNG